MPKLGSAYFHPSSQTLTLPFNISAEGSEAFVDRFVAAVDDLRVVDDTTPFGAAGGDQHGHAGADVRTAQPRAVQF